MLSQAIIHPCLHVAEIEVFQDPHGFAYFSISFLPVVEHEVIDPEYLRSDTLTYLASGIALPSLQRDVYAFILGDGRKKIPGKNHIFAPTTINKTYTLPKKIQDTSNAVLL